MDNPSFARRAPLCTAEWVEVAAATTLSVHQPNVHAYVHGNEDATHISTRVTTLDSHDMRHKRHKST